MEEKFNQNQKTTTQEPKKQEPKKKEPSAKTKKKKAKVAVITLSTVIVLFVSLQVYASVNGYGNVFFMIKNLITTGNPAGVVEGKDEIFSDQDITLSYKSIEVAEGLKIQANRLEIKDGKTKMYLSVKSENDKLLPLKYEATTLFTDGAETAKKEIEGNKPQNTDYYDYEDIITLDYEVNENAIITLKISDTSNKELRTLEINLETREITVKGEKEFEKISEIELKKYLDAFSLLNDISNYTVNDNLLEIATKIQTIDNSKIVLKRETINEIAKQIYGENVKFETKKDSQGKDIEVLKDLRVGTYEELDDVYHLMEHDRVGKCLKIEDIKFENEIYTVKYIYLVATGEEASEDKLEELPQYETTIKLKRKDMNTYSKYEIVSIEKGTEVKNKVSTDINEEEVANINLNEPNGVYKTANSSNYTSNFTDSENGRVAMLKLGEKALQTEMKDGYYIYTDMYGNSHDIKTVTIIDSKFMLTNKTNDAALFKCTIHNVNKDGQYNSFSIALILNKDFSYPTIMGDYLSYTGSTSFTRFAGIYNGENEEDNTNTVNDNTTSNTYTSSLYKEATSVTLAVSQNVDKENWKESYIGNISTNFKYPKNFDIYTYEKMVYVGGGIQGINNENIYVSAEIERLPVEDLEVEDDLDRTVQSKDNNGWTDWKPVKKYGLWNPTNGMLQNGGVRRTYARTKNGTAIFARFDFHTNAGLTAEHYTFIRNILENVSSTGV